MKKIKKYCKWSMVTVLILFVIGFVIGSFGDDRHSPHGGFSAQGFRGGSQFIHHGGFHGIGFILSIVLWGIIIAAVVSWIRKRAVKRGSSLRVTTEPIYMESSQLSSANGHFLDQWEKNLNQPKEN